MSIEIGTFVIHQSLDSPIIKFNIPLKAPDDIITSNMGGKPHTQPNHKYADAPHYHHDMGTLSPKYEYITSSFDLLNVNDINGGGILITNCSIPLINAHRLKPFAYIINYGKGLFLFTFPLTHYISPLYFAILYIFYPAHAACFCDNLIDYFTKS